MNSFSRGNLITRVASSLLTQRSTLPKILPTVPRTSARTVRTQSMSNVSAAQHAESSDGLVARIFKKYNLFNLSHIRLKQSGYILYESVADKIDYTRFFIEFNMTDSFFSWFLITELHVWMLMVRTMAEAEDGKIARNSMIEAMWNDSATRAKVLWSESPSGVKKQVQELSEQFNYAIIAYDEGVNGDDKVLAAAIWRRFFQLERNNPEDVEKLLRYVRKQIQYLDNLPREDVLLNPNIKWLPLDES